MKKRLLGVFISVLLISIQLKSQVFYQQTGTDPSWQYILDHQLIPINVNSTAGITGSKIDVNNAFVEMSAYGSNPIINSINIHTVGNSVIPRSSFSKWTRWYQEDGHTQIFRLFKGEYNVRNTRANAARIESFTTAGWKYGDGWQEWVGTYTIVKPLGASLFQVKNTDNDWAVMITMNDNGDITYQPRGGTYKKIATAMGGKSFDLRMRDNGLNYEVYFNGVKVGSGAYARPTGQTGFRWGMYVGSSIPSKEGMIFVSGATMNPTNSNPCANNPLPSVSITAPLNNASFVQGSNISLSANAMDNGSVSKVEFFNGNTLLGTDTQSPYTLSLNNLPVGNHILTAKAIDNCGGVKTSAAVAIQITGSMLNTLPAVTFTKPLNQASFTAPATLVVNVSASDADAGDAIAGVSLYLNSVLVREEVVAPYDWNHNGQDPALQNLPAGNYILRAVAKDTHGATKETSIVIVITGSVDPCLTLPPPTIAITAPANNAQFEAGQTISISANASSHGTISKVEFLQGNTLVMMDAVSPFVYSTSTLASGTYSFTAKVYDGCGKISVSTPVTINVSSAVNTDPIVGVSCAKPNQSISFQISEPYKKNATSYSWWFTGSSQSVMPSASGADCVVNTGQYFNSGSVCVGVRLSVAPYYSSYCKPISTCAARLGDGEEETVLNGAVALYPNPATSGVVFVDARSFGEVPQSIQVVNSEGDVVWKMVPGSLLTEIQTQGFASGLYTIRVTFENHSTVEKMMIQK